LDIGPTSISVEQVKIDIQNSISVITLQGCKYKWQNLASLSKWYTKSDRVIALT